MGAPTDRQESRLAPRSAHAPRWLRVRNEQLSAGAACTLLLCLAQTYTSSAQLMTNPTSQCAANPFAGQGDLPDGHTAEDFPVETAIQSISLIKIDENKFTASLYLGWKLAYNDPDSVAAMQSNYSSCQFFCNTQMSVALNAAGQPTCCDGVFIPSAQASNSRGYYVQEYAERWQTRAVSQKRLTYFRSLQGVFEIYWHQGAFPFDRHYVLVDVLTAFLPVLSRNGNQTQGAAFSLVDGFAQPQGQQRLRVTANPDYYRPAIDGESLPAWDVQSIFMEVVQLQRKFTNDPLDFTQRREAYAHAGDASPGFQDLPPGQWRGGQLARYAVRVYIEIQRRSTGFWVMASVLPVALVTIFGFAVQSLPRQALKARTELLSTLFLSLVLLQTVLYQFLPPLCFLALPLLLVLVGYVYTLLLFLVIIIAHAQEGAWRRRQLKHQRRWAAQTFGWWAEQLELGPGAQGALAQSASRRAVPFEITQVLEGSRLRKQDSQAREARVSDAAKEVEWLQRHAHRWYFRVAPLRLALEWYKFTGLNGSQEYCRWVANRFDQGARLVLLLTYVAVVVGLCLWTSSQRDTYANLPIYPA